MTNPPEILDPADSRFCLHCGYNLHGLPSNRCPECGKAFDEIPQSPIPWAHRKKLGSIRALFSTMIFASFKPGRLATSVVAPVDARDARLFRYIILFFAAVPFIVWITMAACQSGGTNLFSLVGRGPGMVTTLIYPPPTDRWWQLKFIWSAGATLWGVLQIAIAITVVLATAAPRRLVDATAMPNHWRPRAAAASQYLCAPLALLALPATLSLLIQCVFRDQELPEPFSFLTPPPIVFVYAMAAIALLYWWNTIWFAMKVSRDDPMRGLFCGLCLPVSWAVAIIIGGGIFPFIVGFIWLMIDGFR